MGVVAALALSTRRKDAEYKVVPGAGAGIVLVHPLGSLKFPVDQVYVLVPVGPAGIVKSNL